MNIKPGAGWRHLYGAVYEHQNGMRIHLMGFVKLPNGKFLDANKYPDSAAADRMIKINGGNRKRGLMSWAMTYSAK